MRYIWIFLVVIFDPGLLLSSEASQEGSDLQSADTSESQELKCPPCDRIHCSLRKARKLQRCKGGIVKGVCGCCLVCAKLDGQRCGGGLNIYGTCDKGFNCRLTNNSTEGVCVEKNKGPRSLALRSGPPKSPKARAQQDDTASSLWGKGYCRPACTPEFCLENPNQICSAHGVSSSEVFPCQGDCQHTSCHACQFFRDTSCTKCRQDDWKCLRDFGKCVKRETCTRTKYPCKTIPFNMYESPGEFRCQVPSCADP